MKIKWEHIELTAELYSSDSAEALYHALPFEAELSQWGDELYGRIDALIPEGDKRAIMEEGEIGFWPSGNAICLFWGKTPASSTDKPEAVEPIVPIGQIKENHKNLGEIPTGSLVCFERGDN